MSEDVESRHAKPKVTVGGAVVKKQDHVIRSEKGGG